LCIIVQDGFIFQISNEVVYINNKMCISYFHFKIIK
jgi:hypothetical protein